MPMPESDYFLFKYLEEKQPFVFNAIYDNNLNLLSLTEEIQKKKLFKKSQKRFRTFQLKNAQAFKLDSMDLAGRFHFKYLSAKKLFQRNNLELKYNIR